MAVRPPSGGKVCGICGKDCSSRPRVKDAQGHYFCKACCDQAKQDRAARIGGSDVGGSKMGGSAVEPSVPAATPPLWPADDGFDALAEAAASAAHSAPVEVARSVRDVEPRAPRTVMRHGDRDDHYERQRGRGMPSFFTQPWFAFAVPAVGFGLFAAAASDNTGLAAAYMMLQGLFSLTVTVFILVAAFRTSLGTGFLTLCLPFYIFYFVLVVNENTHLKALFAANILAYVISIILGVGIAATAQVPAGFGP